MCLILYGSATGNASDLADTLHDSLRRRPLESVAIKPFGKASIEELKEHTHIFIICSTTGQGVLPPCTKPFWLQLLKKSLGNSILRGVQIYSFGLGSSAYPKYNWATRKIHARMLQLGATEAIPRGEGNDMGEEPYESVFGQWMSMALSQLDSDLQICDVVPLETLLPAIIKVDLLGKSESAEEPISFGENGSAVNRRMVGVVQKHPNATVLANDRITSSNHFQDVRNLVIECDDSVLYEPGDVVCLHPSNDKNMVDVVMNSQNWNNEIVSLEDEEISLRNLLTYRVDLNAIPRRKFFAVAQHFCSNPRQKERMQEFSLDLDDLFNYTSRPRRSIAEVIAEFDSLSIPISYVVDLLPPLRSRQFSIASPCGSKKIELTVAIVKYRTILKRTRLGVCTQWISKLESGSRIFVSFELNKMKLVEKLENFPAILVATGTGIAPIRALLKSVTKRQPWLFFGCRNEDDFLYADELAGLARVVTAFSRASEPRKYVQNRIVEHASELDILSSFIFVCGSAGAMPQSVRKAIIEVLLIQNFSFEEAERLVSLKEKRGEYFQETW